MVSRSWRPRAQKHLFSNPIVEARALPSYERTVRNSSRVRGFAEAFNFFNGYVEESAQPDNKTQTTKTTETASHVVRVVQQLPQVQFLVMDNINLTNEHPSLPVCVAALTSIQRLNFYTNTPTRLVHLARFLKGFPNLSTLSLHAPILSDTHSLQLPRPCYQVKSSLQRLDVFIQPGGQHLIDWLLQARTLTTSLENLQVEYNQSSVPPTELPNTIHAIQSLLENSRSSLKMWYFFARTDVKPQEAIIPGR